MVEWVFLAAMTGLSMILVNNIIKASTYCVEEAKDTLDVERNTESDDGSGDTGFPPSRE